MKENWRRFSNNVRFILISGKKEKTNLYYLSLLDFINVKAEKYDLTPCLNQFCGTNQSIIFNFVSVNQNAHFLFPHSFYYELELTYKNVVPIHSTFSNKLFQLAGGNKTSL